MQEETKETKINMGDAVQLKSGPTEGTSDMVVFDITDGVATCCRLTDQEVIIQQIPSHLIQKSTINHDVDDGSIAVGDAVLLKSDYEWEIIERGHYLVKVGTPTCLTVSLLLGDNAICCHDLEGEMKCYNIPLICLRKKK